MRQSHSKPCQIDVQKSNLSTFYQFRVFARLRWEQLEVEVSSRTLWAAKGRKFNGQFGLWRSLYTRSRESLLKPGASQLVYRATAFTMERRRARHKPVGAVRHRRRTPRAFARPLSCLQAKQPADVDDREEIIRPIASPGVIALHLGLPHSWGALFLFLHVKVRVVITKTLLATNREQPKPVPTGQDTNSTKRQ